MKILKMETKYLGGQTCLVVTLGQWYGVTRKNGSYGLYFIYGQFRRMYQNSMVLKVRHQHGFNCYIPVNEIQLIEEME